MGDCSAKEMKSNGLMVVAGLILSASLSASAPAATPSEDLVVEETTKSKALGQATAFKKAPVLPISCDGWSGVGSNYKQFMKTPKVCVQGNTQSCVFIQSPKGISETTKSFGCDFMSMCETYKIEDKKCKIVDIAGVTSKIYCTKQAAIAGGSPSQSTLDTCVVYSSASSTQISVVTSLLAAALTLFYM